MADSRHRHTAPRTIRRRSFSSRALLPAAGLLTLGGVTAAVIAYEDGSTAVRADAATPKKQDLFAASVSQGRAPAEVSRSAERAPLPNPAAVESKIEGLRFAVAPVEIHASAKSSSPVLATVASGDTVDITGVTKGDWTQIVHKGLPRWVKSSSVTKVMPLGTAPCASGSGPERGLRPDTIKVHRAACFKFPSVVRYGGIAGRGEHATGQAIDIMVGTGNPIGYEIADFMRANAAKLGISQVIWHQHIWTVQRAGDGWRAMPSRGGATANHMDHVHVTTYGNSATE